MTRSRKASLRAAGSFGGLFLLLCLGTGATPAQSTVCADQVQGRIAWDYRGSTRWSPINVQQLCAGAEDSVAPARCFDRAMHGGVEHGGGAGWTWQDALALCAGTRDANATIGCFESRRHGGLAPAAAIDACRSSSEAGDTNQLIVQFDTGGDDLRGGNDNVHLLLLQQGSAPLRFENVNDRRSWANKSSYTVTRPLPATLRFADIVGVRLEVTASGGAGGDNWNLDRLIVKAQIAGALRQLYDQRGTPLFRFTGDHRVREFRFSSVPVPPAPAVRTRFRPEVHGFKFQNSFKNIFISELDWTTSGLCGGMIYSALDYYNARRSVPSQDYMPAEGTVLQSYVYNRQVKSIERNLDKWAEYGFNPFGSRNREFFNWGLQVGSGRLGELSARIDKGQPVPLGLQSCGDDCGCPGGCPGNHQVLAIGYELGRYKGDLGDHAEDVSIFIYDPNYPNETVTLKPDVSRAMYSYKEEPQKRWRAYFVDLKYSPAQPPTISQAASELMVEFGTGGDDLRGGNDNVHMVLLLRSGDLLRFDNVNDRKRWINGSSQTISRPLPPSLRFEDIVGVRLETTFGGGMGGDNWNLDCLVVRASIGGAVRELYNKSDRPLFRFTGQQRVREFRF